MPRRARPYLYKVSGVRMRHTLRTGNKSTNKHATTTTTIADAAKLAGNIAHASLGLSPRHPPPLHPPPGMPCKLRHMRLYRTHAMHADRNAGAASPRYAREASYAAARQGRAPGHRRQGRDQWPPERPRQAAEHGRPFFHQTGFSRENRLEGLRK